MSSKDNKYGNIQLSGKDIATPTIKFDRLAIGNRGELYLVSMVAETQTIKQARAILNGGAKAAIQASGIHVNRPGDADWNASQPGHLYPTPEGYACYTQKLDYGQAHALFVTRTPGFMRVVSEESLWQELNDSRFTTPILRQWLHFVELRLREDDYLMDARSFNCRCGILTALTINLDDIVSKGLKAGAITIPQPEQAT